MQGEDPEEVLRVLNLPSNAALEPEVGAGNAAADGDFVVGRAELDMEARDQWEDWHEDVTEYTPVGNIGTVLHAATPAPT